jgi:hypothetical protein
MRICVDFGNNMAIGVDTTFYLEIVMCSLLDIIPFWGDVEKTGILVPQCILFC